jgi:predicted transcriptional regulator
MPVDNISLTKIFPIGIFICRESIDGRMINSVKDIRRARKSVEWTQKDLADATDLSQSAIAKIEKGRYSLSHETFLRIQDVLDRKMAEGGDRLTLGDVMVPAGELITVSPEEPIGKAVRLMEEHSISQIPVFEAGRTIGTVTSNSLASAMMGPPIHTVRKAMIHELPLLHEDMPITPVITAILAESHAILVTRAGEIVGIVTSEDVLRRSVRE